MVAVLFTAFGYDLMNSNPFAGSQESLPLFVYRNIRKPDISAIERGFAGALVLMLLVMALFALARWIGRDRSKRRGAPKGGGAAVQTNPDDPFNSPVAPGSPAMNPSIQESMTS
jgi:hypothetical protein